MRMEPGGRKQVSDISSAREDLRHQLEQFYAALHLAPPYDTVEKALQALGGTLQSMEPDERMHVLSDESRRWKAYLNAVRAAGLHLKHRGIILGLIRTNQTGQLTDVTARFLEAYRP